MKHNILKGSLAGLIAGLILGFLMKWVEILTSVRVYTLLLNVDYVPFIQFNEFGDFMLHLIVSIPLAIVLLWVVNKAGWKQGVLWRLVVICIIVGILLYPLTLLSERTPSISSIPAIGLWMFGHAVYGLILGLMYKKENRMGSV